MKINANDTPISPVQSTPKATTIPCNDFIIYIYP
ncbi:Variable outer membrane protein (plasmid) [Borrelia hermsii YBT]|uniref:Variable outer membrane protein n=1 Tax=Borrelia hermsii YBT TaxID=1313295 RepID=W5T1Q6_BORHE|nr:Variable outer membrane protein [Borrelia hermsii YBT]